ncbi:hypothetical protein HYALB_00008742 [Hymenoscyphus albidus]|uniref:JmjC domain-containing protein n=1 Tax=Hymenoscyphus albidus TaxID=595503 RepID=A0A9N9Q2Y0_9HELO|nr:hypothetical protein HYALB_00008742 [Hymenoscyphus albidus]
MDPAPNPSEDPIVTLLESYNDFNSAQITVLYEEPSALEFMRYVAINRPFVVRGAANDWEATRTWNVAKLNEVMGGLEVNVAITPKGNADSPTKDPSGTLLFAKPLEEKEEFTSFLTSLTTQELKGHTPGSSIKYAQTQNNNLNSEYTPLSTHVPASIPFSRLALQNQPDAVNLWIGNSHSVTALHKDPYENIYVQILGAKHFVLLPPIMYPCIREKELKSASYVRDSEGGLRIELDGEGNEMVPFATWDPDEGGGREGHDMEFGGSFYPLVNLVRNLTLAKEKENKTTADSSE